MIRYIAFADKVSAWFGKAFAWAIMIMAFGVGYEVFVRYVLNAPTSWAFDLSYIMYGTLFMMGGAYTLSRDGHVRGDFIYRLWRPQTQAKVELVLYFLFFFPGVLALVITGSKYAAKSWSYTEASINSPVGIPIFQFKTIIPIAGALLVIQGIAQIFRCIHCIRTGVWLRPEDDIEETEQQLVHSADGSALIHGSEAVDYVAPSAVMAPPAEPAARAPATKKKAGAKKKAAGKAAPAKKKAAPRKKAGGARKTPNRKAGR